MEILTKINWVDVLAAIIILRISYVAFQDGLSHEIFPLIGIIGTIVLSLHYYDKLAIFISQNLTNAPIEVLEFLSFLILIISIGLLFKTVRVVLDKIIKVTWHPLIEKFGGLLAGIIRASIVVSTILIILALTPIPYLQWSIRDRSLTGMYFLRIAPAIYEKASIFLPGLKPEGTSVSKDSMTKKLVLDKSLAPQSKKKRETKTAEWEKVFH